MVKTRSTTKRSRLIEKNKRSNPIKKKVTFTQVKEETKEDEIDRKFIIKNNIGLFPRIGTRGVGDEIIDLIRNIHQFNWVKNGLTGNFESTLCKATQGDIQHMKQNFIEKRLTLVELNDDGEHTKIYEIKKNKSYT